MALIDISTARSIALFHVASKSSSAIADKYTLAFLHSKIQEEPVVIYDLTGEPVFYDFYFQEADRIVGRIRLSADTDFGSIIYSIESTQDIFNIKEIEQRADKKLSETIIPDNIVGRLLVCYSYPKIGIAIKYSKEGKELTAIYDIYDDIVVSFDWNQDGSSFLEDIDNSIEGIVVPHSMFEELPEAGENTKRAKIDIDSVNTIVSEILPEAGELSDMEFSDEDYVKLSEHFGSSPPVIRSSILPINIVGQQTPVYCAVACAQMMLSYYGFSFTQDQIAASMNVGERGTYNRDQISGYQQLSNNRLVPEYDRTPTFEEALDAIDSLVPLKSGVPGHARVCRGWKKYIYISPITAEILKEEVWLLINDPYPTGQGSVRWENINNHNYQNFLYLKRP